MEADVKRTIIRTPNKRRREGTLTERCAANHQTHEFNSRAVELVKYSTRWLTHAVYETNRTTLISHQYDSIVVDWLIGIRLVLMLVIPVSYAVAVNHSVEQVVISPRN